MSNVRGIISTCASGVDLVVEWKIEDFFNLPENGGSAYWSPYFSFGGVTWCLGIYPNSSRGSDTSGHVDLRIWKDLSDRSIKQSFSLSLKTAEGEKYNEQHFSKDFNDIEEWFYRFRRFIPRSELTTRRSELVPEGDLTVICTMKSSTSVESDKEEVPTAEVNKSDVAGSSKSEASGSSQADTTTTKESVLKWIKENYKVASKGKKRKTEKENVLKWIEQNFSETSEEKKRKMEEKNGVCASESSSSLHEKKLAQDLKEFFFQKEDCDVIIKVKGLEIPAHRFILKARSPVFASTFRHDMKESATGVVEIEDCDPSPFSDFLYFLYCGDVGMILQENVFSLFTLADKYEVLDLKAKCLEFMKRNLTIDTFCETITLALQHSETELIALATDFFVKNAEEILLTVKWQTFAAENPMQSNELVIKFVRWVKHYNTRILVRA